VYLLEQKVSFCYVVGVLVTAFLTTALLFVSCHLWRVTIPASPLPSPQPLPPLPVQFLPLSRELPYSPPRVAQVPATGQVAEQSAPEQATDQSSQELTDGQAVVANQSVEHNVQQ